MSDLVLSVLMLAGAALLGGGIYLLRTRKNRRQGVLMIIAALVMFGNVAIGSIPMNDSNLAPSGDRKD